MKALRIAPGLELPLDAVTQTFGILAVRGAGKSNTARALAEEMHAAGLPFVAIDPVGSWWGLRSAGEGGPGLPIPIFGGRHGDIPLERTGGQLIADLVVDRRLSCVIDVSEFSEGDKTRFLIDFGERLYRRNTEQLHLFLEEADDYIPQRPMREQAHCLRVFENIVRRGRARGLGMTLITQRSAAINKNVLTQIETLFVMRTTSPQDRAAVEDWVKYQGQSLGILKSLAGLESGEAWVWSPQWLRLAEPVRVRIRRARTFDSGATPKDVKSKRPPATMADVDLSTLRREMAATIERAKAEDPRELRKEIASLRAELAKAQKSAPAPKVEKVEVPIMKPAEVARLELAVDRLTKVAAAIDREGVAIRDLATSVLNLVRISKHPPPLSVRRSAPIEPLPPLRGIAAPTPTGASVGKSGLRRILIALAQRPGLTNRQIGIRAGISSKSGTFSTYLSRARSEGWIADDGDRRFITPLGQEALGAFEPLPSGAALLEHWLRELGGGAARMLRAIAEAYPKALSNQAIGEAASVSHASGTFSTYMSRLRTLELVTSSRGLTKASDELFEES